MITLIIAIIGALTGIIGLIIQFIEYKKSQVRLKIKFIDEKSFYTTGSTSYKCKYFGVISLKISNCSSLPITLDEVKINSSTDGLHCHPEDLKIATGTMTKMRCNEEVALSVLLRICEYLDCNIGDICDAVKVDKDNRLI